MGEGLGSHDFFEKSQLVAPSTGEMGGDFSRSNGGPNVAMATSFHSVDSPCNDIEVKVFPAALVTDVPVMDCPISRVEGDLYVSNSDGQSSFTNPMDFSIVGCSTMHSMSSVMLCHQSLLEQNCFSPLSELGSDTFEKETLLLNKVNPTRSDEVRMIESCWNFYLWLNGILMGVWF